MASFINDGMPFTRAQAPDLGLTDRVFRDHVHLGLIRRVFRGVFVDHRVPDSRAHRLRAIKTVSADHVVACDETAAWLWGPDVFSPRERHNFQPSLVVPHGTGRVRHEGSRGRQALIPSSDITQIDGVRVTTPIRTASDLLRKLYRPYALAAADAMAAADLIDAEELLDFVSALKGYRGIVQARSLAAIVDPRMQSPGESWQRLRIHDAGFPPTQPQYEIVDDFGRTYFIDLPYPELLIGTEFDGREFHSDDAHRAHDDDRRGYLSEVYGWRWVIGTRERLFGTDTSFEDELGSLLDMKPIPRWWGAGLGESRWFGERSGLAPGVWRPAV